MSFKFHHCQIFQFLISKIKDLDILTHFDVIVVDLWQHRSFHVLDDNTAIWRSLYWVAVGSSPGSSYYFFENLFGRQSTRVKVSRCRIYTVNLTLIRDRWTRTIVPKDKSGRSFRPLRPMTAQLSWLTIILAQLTRNVLFRPSNLDPG